MGREKTMCLSVAYAPCNNLQGVRNWGGGEGRDGRKDGRFFAQQLFSVAHEYLRSDSLTTDTPFLLGSLSSLSISFSTHLKYIKKKTSLFALPSLQSSTV